MKRFLPLTLAASVLLLSGCHTADIPEADHDEATHDGEPISAPSGKPEGLGTAVAVNPTASAFPASTPPSMKPSLTPRGYWMNRKVNTQPGEEGHGEAAGHAEAEGH